MIVPLIKLELKLRGVNETKQWIENTGQGIREEVGEESFQKKIEKERFRHYFTLLPIFSEHACMGASITTDHYDIHENNKASNISQDIVDNTEGDIEIVTPLERVAFLNDNLQEVDERSIRSAGDNQDAQDVEELSVGFTSASKTLKLSEKRKSPSSTWSV